MMQQCTADDHVPNGLGISDMQPPYQEQSDLQVPAYSSQHGLTAHSQTFNMHQQMPQEMFDSPQELNRRTLTQEQFDAYAQHGSALDPAGNYDFLHAGLASGQVDLSQYFPELQGGDVKPQHAFAFQSEIPPPMPSHDSTVPSTDSEQSMSRFPSASSMGDLGTFSTTSSEWADSRSSSVSVAQQEELFAQQQAHAAATSQWQPGQSVPVDFNALSQEFKQVQQAAQVRHSPQHPQEQPLAWPADDAFQRRDSLTSSMLAQSMSTVGIHTPQPQQQAKFKTPAPPVSIAARRQRPRPAALGLASMRSQSYSGAVPPSSPGQGQQHSLTPGQPSIRRIRSSNVINGVAGGRVQKHLPGSAQRSPLSWTFSDAVNSPKAIRHVSSQSTSNLAPPTPLSPSEFPRHDQGRQHQAWPSTTHVSRQPSISETDLEHGVPYAYTVPVQNFSSPPHTPLYHQQSFMQQRVGSNVITENTPPQSAPASQLCFPTQTFNVTQAPLQHSHAPSHQMQAFAPPHQQQFMNIIVPDQHFQVPNMSMSQAQHIMAPTANGLGGLPMQYPQGVPIVNAHGELEMIVPPPFMQQQEQPQPSPQAPAPPQHRQQPPPQQQTHTPPQGGGQYFTFSTAPPALNTNAQTPKQQQPQQPTEFFVHEYSPPAEMKRAVTPRRAAENSGPKNYSFAHSTPEHFVEKKAKAERKAANAIATTASSSPASSSS